MPKTLILLAMCYIVIGTSIPGMTDVQSQEMAAGGLTARNESNISIENERLVISGMCSTTKIVVEYDFLNHSSQDITTLVAFPIPDYPCPISSGHPSEPGFEDFRLWVDGMEVKYDTECKAIYNGHDFTNILTSMGVDISSFGRFLGTIHGEGTEIADRNYQLPELSEDARNILKEFGLIEWDKNFRDSITPRWLVRKKYFWNQRFPAGKVVRMRHEYRAREGITKIFPSDTENFIFRVLPDAEPWTFESACVPERQVDDFRRHLRQHPDGIISAYWVKYILTSANTWKMPIKNFELVIELDKGEEDFHKKDHSFVALCWDGNLLRSKNFLRAIRKDFVPHRDLAVYRFWKVDKQFD